MPTRLLRDWTDSFPVNDLDADAERLFVRLIMKVDDFGRFHADVRLLKANLFPLKAEIRDTDISRWLAACQKAGLLRCYDDSKGRKFLEILNFKQRTRAAESKFPPPGSAPPSDDRHMTVKCPSSAHVFVFGDEVEGGGVSGAAAPPAITMPGIPDWLPKTPEQAVSACSGFPVHPDFVREVWSAVSVVGFRDAANRQITHFPGYIRKRWDKEQMEWEAKRKPAAKGKGRFTA